MSDIGRGLKILTGWTDVLDVTNSLHHVTCVQAWYTFGVLHALGSSTSNVFHQAARTFTCTNHNCRHDQHILTPCNICSIRNLCDAHVEMLLDT